MSTISEQENFHLILVYFISPLFVCLLINLSPYTIGCLLIHSFVYYLCIPHSIHSLFIHFSFLSLSFPVGFFLAHLFASLSPPFSSLPSRALSLSPGLDRNIHMFHSIPSALFQTVDLFKK
jgi:hypothetical protein